MNLKKLFFLPLIFLLFSCILDDPTKDNPKRSYNIFNITSGGTFTCAKFDQKIKCWGQNEGRLGLGNTASQGGTQEKMDALAHVDLGNNFNIRDIQSGVNHTCALSDLGKLKCWGKTPDGYLGQEGLENVGSTASQMGNALKMIDLGTDFIVTKLSESGNCAHNQNGEIKCWGQNSFGQLGIGDNKNKGKETSTMGNNLPKIDLGSDFDVKKIMSSSYSSCALNQSGKLKCWGNNVNGLIGHGYSGNVGDEAGEMGNNLRTMDLGNGFTVADFDLFHLSVCAVSTAGKLKCWGKNEAGEAGQNNKEIIGNDENELRDLPAINLGFTVKQAQVGFSHICALSTTGSIKCWGENLRGQLGYGDTTSRGTGVSGDPLIKDIPNVDLGTGFIATRIEIGAFHSCAINSKYEAKCWGFGYSGQILHKGPLTNIGDVSNDMGNNLKTMVIFK